VIVAVIWLLAFVR